MTIIGYAALLSFLISFVGFVNCGTHLTFYIIEENDKYLKSGRRWFVISVVTLILFIILSKIILT